MTVYDWIVVGAGLAGSTLGYELAKANFSVLVLEQDALPDNGTRYSYGGIAYWSANTPLTQKLFTEGIEIHRQLSDELGADTQFREIDLLLTIAPDDNSQAIAANYQGCMIPPRLVTIDEACEIEPLLNRQALSGALHAKHGHVDPELIVKSYRQAMERLGGKVVTAKVTGFLREGDRITGVTTTNEAFAAANVVVAAGGFTRSLLRSIEVSVPCWFTQADIVETGPLETRLRSLIMPADLQRFQLEAEAGKPENAALWDEPGHELLPPNFDAGAIQLQDGRVRLGQISRVLTDPYAAIDAAASEAQIRGGVEQLLPVLKDVPGQWYTCLVAFCGDHLPLVGAVPEREGLHIFSGFSSPFAVLPPLARRFAQNAAGDSSDDCLAQVSPARFL